MSCKTTLDTKKKELKLKLREKYEYLEESDLDNAFEMAFSDFVSIKYQSDNNRPKREDVDFDYYTSQWVFKRMIDLVERNGGSSVVSYKENGMSWTYGEGFINNSLRSEIMPKAAIPSSRG